MGNSWKGRLAGLVLLGDDRSRSQGDEGGQAGGASTDHRLRGQPAAADRATQQRFGGDLAAGPDGLARCPADARAQDRPGDVHQRGPSPRRPPQLQPRWVRLAVPPLPRWPAPTFTLAQRREIKKVALSRPQDHALPFSTGSLHKLADFLVAEGVVEDISHEGLRALLHEQGVSFQRLKTWKQSRDPHY